MSDDPMLRFAVLFFAGLGLTITGAANLILRQSGIARRSVLAISVLVGVVLVAESFAGAARSIETGLILLAVVVPALVLGSGQGRRTIHRVLDGLGHSAISWGLCLAIGVGAVLCSVVRYESEDQAALDVSMAELEVMVECAGDVGPAPEIAMTDSGERVQVFFALAPRSSERFQLIETELFKRNGLANHVIYRQSSDDHANCHGWVFTGGRYRIDGCDVERILSQNGYSETASPQSGDLAIYRKNGSIAHSAIVRYVAPDMPTLVEGKWGATGVYLHAIDKCPYGQSAVFYRSARLGHLLAGLDHNSDTPIPQATLDPNVGTE